MTADLDLSPEAVERLAKRHALHVSSKYPTAATLRAWVVPQTGYPYLLETSVTYTLRADGIRAIAVSLLWAFRNPVHERRIRELVHAIDPDIYVALSSEVSPRIREFARNSTTIMSTQVGPGLRDYLTTSG